MKNRLISAFIVVVMLISIIPSGKQITYALDDYPWSNLLLDAKKWSNSWDIAAENEQKIIVTSDIAKEEYTLVKKPDNKGYFVKDQENAVLQSVPLDTITDNFEICVELMSILRDSLNGIGRSSKITRLKDNFEKTADTTLVVMSGIKSSSALTVMDYIQAYKYSTSPSYVNAKTSGIDLANKIFEKNKTRSLSMVTQIESLISSYEANEKIANDLFNAILNEYMDDKEKDEAEAKMEDIVKKIDSLKKDRSVLYYIISEYCKDYADFPYELPGQEQIVAKTAAVSTVYSGIAAMFGFPEDDENIISGQKEIVAYANKNIMNEIVSYIDAIANSSASSGGKYAAVNTLIAMRCCMKLMEIYFLDISAFWENAATFFQNMTDRFNDIASAYQTGYENGGSYIDAFRDTDFIEAYFVNMVKWTAFSNISTDGLDSVFELRERYNAYRNEEETYPNTYLERARSNAAALSEKIKGQFIYSGTVIVKRPSGSLIIAVIAFGAIAIVIAKNKANSKEK